MSKGKAITIPTDLLAAVAKWAHADATRAIGVVAFRHNTFAATDGHRVVVVPHEFKGSAFGLTRAHLLAAIAAQNSLARDDMNPQVDHDLVETGDGDVTVADGPYGDRVVELTVGESTVSIGIGAVSVIVPRIDVSKYPSVEQVFVGDQASSPDGYLLDARFLAAVEEVNTASANYRSGVRVTMWSSINDGIRGPLVLENVNGVRFAIMPQRDGGVAS